MTTRLRRKVTEQTHSLPITSVKISNGQRKVLAKPPRSSVMTYVIILAALLMLSCIGVEILSGTKLHPKAVLHSASHHVKRMSRKMKESTQSILKQNHFVQYVNLESINETYDVVVVGCGPSGLTAALFASRMGMSVLVLGNPLTGSLAGTETLDNFPSYTINSGGIGWFKLTMDQAIEFGAQFAPPAALAKGLVESGKEFEVRLSNTPKEQIRSRTVIVASGSTPRKLNLPHESELWGRSLHNCALCDGDAYASRSSEFNTEKTVVVIGGGDAAIEAVSLLHRIGVHTIHWIHRSNKFRGNAAAVERVKSLSNVQLWSSFVVTEWIVKENSFNGNKSLEGVRVVGSIDGVADPDANSSLTISCDGAFLMIGSTPNTQWLKTSGIDIDDFGFIRLGNVQKKDDTLVLPSQTSLPGVFASGEAIDGIYRQALTAASDGARSAMDAEHYLRLSDAPIVPVLRKKIPKVMRHIQTDDVEKERLECDLTKEECIKQVVVDFSVVIFSKSFCSYCHLAKEAMEAEGVNPFVIELDLMGIDGRKVQDTLAAMTGRRTVPNVFVGGEPVGGGTEIVELHESGQLKKMLKDARAI